jgi:predicted NAD/FAD-binding protein
VPFETSAAAPRRIAVIGAGISGMAAAYHLSTSHAVTLFEAEPRLGGHARTVVAGKHGDQPVDTGFIVFNYVNYPHLTKLFADLDVPVVKSDMSFAASIDNGRIEYGLRSPAALFAQKGNLLRPGFLRMLRDLVKFNGAAERLATDSTITLGEFMDDLNMGPWFRDYYLTPISGAIWSTPKEEIMDFPAQALVRFFRNHNLMQASGQHQWYTVQGGSIEYVSRLEIAMRRRGVDIHVAAPIDAVRRTPGGVEVIRDGHPELSTRWSSPPIPTTRCACWPIRHLPKPRRWAPCATSRTRPCCMPMPPPCRSGRSRGRAGTTPSGRTGRAGRST